MGKEPDFQGLLKNKFEHFEAEPDIDLWQGIEEKIQQEGKAWKAWIPYLSIAATIIVLVSVWLVTRQPELNTPAPQLAEQATPSTPLNIEGEETYSQEKASVDFQITQPLPTSPKAKNRKTRNFNQVIPSPSSSRSLTMNSIDEQKRKIEIQKRLKSSRIVKRIQDKNEQLASLTAKPSELPQAPIVKAELSPSSEAQANTNQKAVYSVSKHKTEIDLNKLSLKDAVSFAAEQINSQKESLEMPIKVKTEKTKMGTRKTVEFKIFNVSFSRKTYKPSNKSK
ncbi:MAG: hypothetical protein AAFY71_13650 [Bacteroidota bacterium]